MLCVCADEHAKEEQGAPEVELTQINPVRDSSPQRLVDDDAASDTVVIATIYI